MFCFILFPDAPGDEFERYQQYEYSSSKFFSLFLLISTTRFEIMVAKWEEEKKEQSETMNKKQNENLIASKNVNSDGNTKDVALKCIGNSRVHYGWFVVRMTQIRRVYWCLAIYKRIHTPIEYLLWCLFCVYYSMIPLKPQPNRKNHNVKTFKIDFIFTPRQKCFTSIIINEICTLFLGFRRRNSN